MGTESQKPQPHRIVHPVEHPRQRLVDLTVMVLVLISIVSSILATSDLITDTWRTRLNNSIWFFVVIFSIEYCWRLAIAERRWRYVFSFYGILDLFAVLPFLLGAPVDLRGIKIFRALSAFPLMRATGYIIAMRRFARAFELAREELVLFVITTAMILYVAGLGIYYFEHNAQPHAFASAFHSLWWAVTTLTTVGYGDVYPITAGGRFFTFIVVMVGLGVIAVPASVLASALTRAREEEERAQREQME
jgi:voltage-gated potassium channel